MAVGERGMEFDGGKRKAKLGRIFTMNGSNISQSWFLAALLTAAACPAASDWPQWRGPARDGHLGDGQSLPTQLPKELKPAWKLEVGSGHSSPIVAGGKLIYLDENGSEEVAHGVDITTGKELW